MNAKSTVFIHHLSRFWNVFWQQMFNWTSLRNVVFHIKMTHLKSLSILVCLCSWWCLILQCYFQINDALWSRFWKLKLNQYYNSFDSVCELWNGKRISNLLTSTTTLHLDWWNQAFSCAICMSTRWFARNFKLIGQFYHGLSANLLINPRIWLILTKMTNI